MPLTVSNFQLDLDTFSEGISRRNQSAARVLEADLKGNFYYACNSCSKVFESKDKLKLHAGTHVIPEPKLHRHKHHRSKSKKKKHKKSKKKKIHQQFIQESFKIHLNQLSKIKRTGHDKAGVIVKPNLSSDDGGGTHKCKYCSSRFTSPWNLKVHLQTIHENIRPFQCNQCDKSFKQKIHLLGHFNSTHSNLKPFRCDYCSVKFGKKWNLFDHVKKYHDCSDGEMIKLKLKYSKRKR